MEKAKLLILKLNARPVTPFINRLLKFTCNIDTEGIQVSITTIIKHRIIIAIVGTGEEYLYSVNENFIKKYLHHVYKAV